MHRKNVIARSASAVVIAAALFAPVLAGAQSAPASGTPRIDAVVALDVSGSMRTSGIMPEVQAYLEKEVVRGLLKPGDRLTLIAFGEKPRTLLSRPLESEADRDSLAREIAAIRADDGYTDLGLALESLESALASRTDGSAQAVALFITDGKNAPAPSSPYSGRDLSVDERFKDIGRKITMKGWQLYVVGLGGRTDAAAVAAAVEGSVLAAPKEALAPESLSAYVAETAKATEERAAAAGGAGAATGSGGSSGGGGSGSGGALTIGVILILLGLLVSVALFFLIRARKTKEKEKAEEKEQAEDKDEA